MREQLLFGGNRINTRTPVIITTAISIFFFISGLNYAQYFPPADNWEYREPVEMGFDTVAIQAAINFAKTKESQYPRNLLETHYRTFAKEPFGEAIGPFKVRGPQTGIIVKDGYIIAEWGEPARLDMTFSISKSFISTVVGLAWAEGLIRNIDDPVGLYIPPLILPSGDGEPGHESGNGIATVQPVYLFESEHNRQITWDHLLRQVSDWEGTLWGKPDWSDRPSQNPDEWLTRERKPPGTIFEYNDTRVNLLALAVTLVCRKPIQALLWERIMQPIGASSTWQWHGYENSWITLDGINVQVPSGGGHWGGGMFINTYDMARFGLLTTKSYKWKEKQLLPEEWLKMATTPTNANPGYGFMNFYLNIERKVWPFAPESAWIHLGSGTNLIYCDPENNLVIVLRWIESQAAGEVVEKILQAMK